MAKFETNQVRDHTRLDRRADVPPPRKRKTKTKVGANESEKIGIKLCRILSYIMLLFQIISIA